MRNSEISLENDSDHRFNLNDSASLDKDSVDSVQNHSRTRRSKHLGDPPKHQRKKTLKKVGSSKWR